MDKIHWSEVNCGVIEKDSHYETEDGKLIFWHLSEDKNFYAWVNVQLINTKRK